MNVQDDCEIFSQVKKTVEEKSILLFTGDKPVLSMKWEEVSEAETPTRGQQVKQVVSRGHL